MIISWYLPINIKFVQKCLHIRQNDIVHNPFNNLWFLSSLRGLFFHSCKPFHVNIIRNWWELCQLSNLSQTNDSWQHILFVKTQKVCSHTAWVIDTEKKTEALGRKSCIEKLFCSVEKWSLFIFLHPQGFILMPPRSSTRGIFIFQSYSERITHYKSTVTIPFFVILKVLVSSGHMPVCARAFKQTIWGENFFQNMLLFVGQLSGNAMSNHTKSAL